MQAGQETSTVSIHFHVQAPYSCSINIYAPKVYFGLKFELLCVSSFFTNKDLKQEWLLAF